MIHLPASWATGGKLGALILAQELAQDVGGIIADVAAPTTVLGAMILGERYMSRARREAISMSRETAEAAIQRAADAEARLAAAQATWDARETALLAEITRLRNLLPPPPKEKTT